MGWDHGPSGHGSLSDLMKAYSKLQRQGEGTRAASPPPPLRKDRATENTAKEGGPSSSLSQCHGEALDLSPEHSSSSKPDTLENTIGVYARLRPPLGDEEHGPPAVIVDSNGGVVKVKADLYTGGMRDYRVTKAFGQQATQREVFDAVGRRAVDALFEGRHNTIFAYGQTGTGKTHTLCGDRSGPGRGLLPRCCRAIFERVQRETDFEHVVSVSLVQIYCEQLQDLLNPSDTQRLSIREDADGLVYVPGLKTVCVTSAEEMLEVFDEGSMNRVTARTDMNAVSSRSHACFIIKVKRMSQVVDSTAPALSGMLTLVDLAGSERIKKTNSQGVRREEARHINLSLSNLGNVIHALSDPKCTHVPYRDSVLTRLLQDSLGRTGSTSIVIALGPSEGNLHESNSAMLFGQRAMQVKQQDEVHAAIDYRALCAELKETLRRKEKELTALSLKVATPPRISTSHVAVQAAGDLAQTLHAGVQASFSTADCSSQVLPPTPQQADVVTQYCDQAIQVEEEEDLWHLLHSSQEEATKLEQECLSMRLSWTAAQEEASKLRGEVSRLEEEEQKLSRALSTMEEQIGALEADKEELQYLLEQCQVPPSSPALEYPTASFTSSSTNTSPRPRTTTATNTSMQSLVSSSSNDLKVATNDPVLVTSGLTQSRSTQWPATCTTRDETTSASVKLRHFLMRHRQKRSPAFATEALELLQKTVDSTTEDAESIPGVLLTALEVTFTQGRLMLKRLTQMEQELEDSYLRLGNLEGLYMGQQHEAALNAAACKLQRAWRRSQMNKIKIVANEAGVRKLEEERREHHKEVSALEEQLQLLGSNTKHAEAQTGKLLMHLAGYHVQQFFTVCTEHLLDPKAIHSKPTATKFSTPIRTPPTYRGLPRWDDDSVARRLLVTPEP